MRLAWRVATKMPLATFEGSIRVGQEKAAIVEEFTLTFGLEDAATVTPLVRLPVVPAPTSITGLGQVANGTGPNA